MQFITTDKNKLENYYFIISNELFFLIEIKNQILHKIFDGNPDNSAIVVFDYREKEELIDIDDIKGEIKTGSLFSEKKVIIIKPIEDIDSKTLDKLLSFLNDIPENMYLLFLGKELKKISNKKVILPKNIIHFNSNDSKNIKKYFYEYIKKNKKNIDDNTLDLICNEANFDPFLIKNELDKITFYIADKKVIEIEDFNEVKGIEKEYDIWALINAICNNDEKKAFFILEKIHENFEPEFILGSIFNSIKRIFNVIYYIRVKNFSKNEIINKMGKNAYYLINQTKNFEGVTYADIIDILKEADSKIKLSNRKEIKIIFTIMLEKIFEKISKNKTKL